MKDIRAIFREIDGFFLAAGIFTYTLGTVLALQAGQAWNATNFCLGLGLFFGFYLLESNLCVYLQVKNQRIFLPCSALSGCARQN